MSAGVLCAVRGATETAVVRELARPDGRTEVTRRCADLAELLAAAAAGLGRVAVVSTDLPGLDRESVRHLHGSGAWVVLVPEPRGGGALEPGGLGADAVTGAGGEGVGGLVVALLDEADRTGRRPGSRGAEPASRALGTDRSSSAGREHPLAVSDAAGNGRVTTPVDTVRRADLDRGAVSDGQASPEEGAREPQQVPVLAVRGGLVAVWGPTGAPGRSTTALGIASELASGLEPGQVLLVDADTYGGTLAQRLGLLDESPGLAAAARLAATGRLDAHGLGALSPVLEGGPRVLTGLGRADRWPELPSSSLEVVWQVARELARWTVVDVGFSLEQDEALSYDTRAPRRNAATLSALAEADVVVAVGTGDPIGLQRLVRGLADLAELGVPEQARVVVVNRLRASASGPQPADAVRGALRRYAGVAEVHLLPEDTAVCDGALLAAQTLVEHAPTSTVRRAMADLARVVLARHAPAGAH
ncbi:hypothetical protein J4G33_03685 [Actinotalea sp. BY-33]|uniref:CobQ/CobB/MinD/ParA nucleotide binding domain-containing protein n=1 Tax=Actinotalea soli TaxID=2819234 RepID=A0A939LMN8_9CELL|nr:hypothetical protein [Actinotalea soli]MBO1750897.1 hypothetical protein [Actinotalea soli]